MYEWRSVQIEGKRINVFKTPKSFTLGGILYPVRYVKEVSDDPNLNGMAFLDKHRIDLLASLDDDLAGQVFCHELIHSILGVMGEDEINSNERFVDLFGTFLHQALKTMK